MVAVIYLLSRLSGLKITTWWRGQIDVNCDEVYFWQKVIAAYISESEKAVRSVAESASFKAGALPVRFTQIPFM